MRLLVASDNHGNIDVLYDLISIYQDEVDLFLHCGDTESNVSHEVWQTFQAVRGNTDFDLAFPEIRQGTWDGYEYLMLHGHRHQVRMGIGQMKELAQEEGADIVFYGHTHIPKVEVEDNILFLNPGSIMYPRGGWSYGSYALLEKRKEGLSIEYFDWNHQAIDQLTQIIQL